MKITPLDIQQQAFKRSFLGGYDMKEVDDFLSLVKEEMEKLVLENNRLNDELRKKEGTLAQFQDREKVLKDTMMTVQKVTEDLKDTAKKEGNLIISQAEMHAEKMITTAQQRLHEIIDDINELKRQRAMFEATLRSLIDKHFKLLEITGEEEVRNSAIEDKISFLPKT